MAAALYSAPVVCPMSGPPLADGGVLVVADRIEAVGPAADLRSRADREHRVDGVLLPGLVNAATAVEHADADLLRAPGPLHAWLPALAGLTAGWDDEAWSRSARRGVHLLLRAGTTAVGDSVTRGPGVPACSRAGLVGDSRVEVSGVDSEHADAVLAALDRSLDLPAAGRRVALGVRSPVEVGTGVLQAVAALAVRRGRPLHVAAARTQSEVAALRAGEGPAAAAARERGYAYEWLDGGADLSPIRYLDAVGALGPSTSVGHGSLVDVLETRLLAERGATVVCCPRADERRGGGRAPLERFADAGVALALGTDSPASAPDLDLLDEARAWVALARERELGLWPGAHGPTSLEEQAIRLATVDGARAMGWDAGVLEPGRRADLVGVAVVTTPDRAYRDLVEQGPGRVVLTVLGGVRRARRDDADIPWPPLDRHELEP